MTDVIQTNVETAFEVESEAIEINPRAMRLLSEAYITEAQINLWTARAKIKECELTPDLKASARLSLGNAEFVKALGTSKSIEDIQKLIKLDFSKKPKIQVYTKKEAFIPEKLRDFSRPDKQVVIKIPSQVRKQRWLKEQEKEGVQTSDKEKKIQPSPIKSQLSSVPLIVSQQEEPNIVSVNDTSTPEINVKVDLVDVATTEDTKKLTPNEPEPESEVTKEDEPNEVVFHGNKTVPNKDDEEEEEEDNVGPKLPSADKCALVIVDMQNDFCDRRNGALYIPGSEQLLSTINHLQHSFNWGLIVYTTDYHPPDHCSFYETWRDDPEARMLRPYKLPSGDEQLLWPAHCIAGSTGAELYHGLDMVQGSAIIRKGESRDVDGYSAFFDNEFRQETGLRETLEQRGIKHVFVTGLASDFCVAYSALDARSLHLDVYVIADATRAISEEGGAQMNIKELEAGIKVAGSSQVEKILEDIQKPRKRASI